MKAWHVLVVAASIVGGLLGGSAIMAARQPHDWRYHYSNFPIDNRLTRIDRIEGTVEVYDTGRGWHDIRAR